MKVSSLLDVLRNFEAAAAIFGGTSNPGSLNELRQMFTGYEEEDLSRFVNAIIKQRDIQGRKPNTPPLAHLHEALTKLEACLRSAEGKKGADDLAKVAELVEGCGQCSVSAFVSEARDWVVEARQPKPKPPPKLSSAKPPRKKPPVPLVETLPLDEYARRLKQFTGDNTQFDELIARLRGDKKVKVVDMREIARLFLGYEIAKKKGRDAALAAIIEQQQVSGRQDARGSLLNRLKSW
jgi:hypothetical protein